MDLGCLHIHQKVLVFVQIRILEKLECIVHWVRLVVLMDSKELGVVEEVELVVVYMFHKVLVFDLVDIEQREDG